MKNKIGIILGILIFGCVGIFMIFFYGNVNEYDSHTKAYKIAPNSRIDDEGGVVYTPTYYFKVDGKEYECTASASSGIKPKIDNNTVYYNSDNPEDCKTEYEKSTGLTGGIICLAVTALIIYFGFFHKSVTNYSDNDLENQQIDEESLEKVKTVVGKVQLIIRRVILGIIILVLAAILIFKSFILKQTIISKNYIETIATYTDRKSDSDDINDSFDDYIYTITDTQGNQREIIVSISKDDMPQQEIKIRYNENDPQDYYDDGSTFDKKELIVYIVEVVILLLLILLFFNKKLLLKLNITMGGGRTNDLQ